MGTPRMRAISQDEFGSPEVLRPVEVPRPSPLPTEVLVQVHSAGVNPVDLKTRSGAGMAAVLGDPPFILGWDVAGVVVERGFGVHTLRVGDEVFGMPWFPRQAGAYAEYVTAPSRQFVRRPTRLDQDQAAAVPLAALTAWQALVDTAGVQGGQRVLIQAATAGCRAFRRPDREVPRCLRHGDGPRRQVRRRPPARRGRDGRLPHHPVRGRTARRGRRPRSGRRRDRPDQHPLARRPPARRPPGRRPLRRLPRPGRERPAARPARPRLPGRAGRRPALATLASLVDEGRIEVLLGGTLPLDQAAEAHGRLERGEVEGKIVLRVDH
ncbi:hypothetical protein HEB94_004464 [Actinopolymorpha pittospori]|uniref:Enoyl reductase (ER) domain-containing protein n=1 Tax=Actinopolymorpha pittospori TaxID=648752 RepID=A0A927MWA5_9ACTN|nr:hypothetical protein [Actinopolymorpha pittospori]